MFSKILGFKFINEGTTHWFKQRISSIFLIPLTVLFVFPLGEQLGMEHSEIVEIYSNPYRAIIAVFFLGVTFIHLQQGLQVVIEDYIHTVERKKFLLLFNLLFFWCLLLCVLFSFGKLLYSS
jgi:succinate dehydrogenase / fumarate reductase membrane anchor subunit